MSRGRRVVHLFTKFWARGVQIYVERLIPCFSGDFRHEVWGLLDPGSMMSRYKAAGIRVRRCDVRGLSRPAAVEKLTAALRKHPPEILHAHDRFPLMIAMEAGEQAGIPVRLAHYHTPHPFLPWEEADLECEREALRRSTRIFFNAEATRRDLFQRIPEAGHRPWAFVPNAVDLSRYRPAADGLLPMARGVGGSAIPVIGILARIDPVKNHELLIDAAALLKRAGVAFELWIVGTGWKTHVLHLKERVRNLGLGDRIHFKGQAENPEEFFRGMDLFVICSRSEGMPLTVLEAWACGVPVVGTRVSGIADMLRDGVDGVLCEPENSAALVDAMTRVLGDAELQGRLRSEGLRRVQEFGARRVAARLEDIYGELAGRNVLGAALMSRWRRRRKRPAV